MIVPHGITLFVQPQRFTRKIGIRLAGERVTPVPMQHTRPIASSKTLVAFEGIETGDATIEIERFVDRTQVLFASAVCPRQVPMSRMPPGRSTICRYKSTIASNRASKEPRRKRPSERSFSSAVAG